MGPSWGDAMQGGGGTGRLVKFLLRGVRGGVVFWFIDLGVVGANSSEGRGISCGFP